MRVLVAGASGAIGRPLCRQLHGAGHDVIGLARSEVRLAAVEGLDARVVADALDAGAVDEAVRRAEPEVVVNVLTAIPSQVDSRRMASQFEQTNRLRREATSHLAAAAQRQDARLISESIAIGYQPGAGLATEDAPLWTRPPRQFRPVLEAVRELEQLTLDAGGVVLRFGHFYGPGTGFDHDGAMLQGVRAGKLPLVGGGHAVFSFVHVVDAASAVEAAMGAPEGTTFNVVDGEPLRTADWLPWLAGRLGAAAPKPLPVPVARLFAGGWGVAFLNELRGADNRRAGRELGWTPRYPSFRDGMTELLNAGPARADRSLA